MDDKDQLERERRRQILDAAEKVFADRGIDRARMDDIVDASGLAKGTLYWYFKSKDAIINALIDRFFAGEMERTKDLVDAEGSSLDRIEIFLHIAVQEMQRFELLLPLAYEMFSLVSRNKHARSRMQDYYRQYIDLLAELIRQGVDAGEIRPVDPQEAALAAGALIEGIALYWFIDPKSVEWDRMEPMAFSILRQGLIDDSNE